MGEKERIIRWIRYRIRSLGMLEVQRILEEKYLSVLDEMEIDELKRLEQMLRMDDWSLRRKLLEED